MKSMPTEEQVCGAQEIIKAGERAEALTRQLLAFSSSQIFELEYLDINKLVGNFAETIPRVIGENVWMRLILDHQAGTIHADRGQIEQILTTLCLNARDAMPGGGVIVIKTENMVLDENYCSTHPWAAMGRHVLLSVTDIGRGMDDHTRTRLFESFSATKEADRGTGLGLAAVYGIVRQHHGMIEVFSEIGTGTKFNIYLPAFECAASEIAPKTSSRPAGGSETILLAEEDDSVRELTARLLKDAGYTVLSAGSGWEAIGLFSKNAQNIDLMVVDAVLPDFSGKCASEMLIKYNPSLCFLFLSGCAPNPVLSGFASLEGMDSLQKPYTPDALLCMVRKILDKSRNADEAKSKKQRQNKIGSI